VRVQANYRWLYLLVVLPTISDLLETGAWPVTRRSWITEIGIGIVILALVRHLRSVHAQLLALTFTDPLTGLRNRRGFIDAIEAGCARSRRSLEPLSLVCIDLDNFKQINDSAGHGVGDRVLRQLGEAIGAAVRANVDHAFRLGGDEFALLLPGITAADCAKLLERINTRCRDADPIWENGLLNISAGSVEYQPPETAMNLVRRADAAMYQAKRQCKPAPLRTPVTFEAARVAERLRARSLEAPAAQ
jgi:diguanylate cyclase (GGDEF)-like protein